MYSSRNKFFYLAEKMEESTLMLAKSIARQSLEDDENEAIDGSPKPLRKNHASRLEAKLQGFR